MGIFSRFRKGKAPSKGPETVVPAKKPAAKSAAKKGPAKKAPAKKAASKNYQPQCAALTSGGDQCRNSARAGSKYCGSHKGYQPPSSASVQAKKDTTPKAKKAADTVPGRGVAKGKAGSQAQCAAVTADGKQCKNSSRAGSKYCGSHKSYRAGSDAAKVKKADTKPRVAGAADTKPSVRKPAAKKAPAKKPAAKKSAANKPAAKKPAARKPTSK